MPYSNPIKPQLQFKANKGIQTTLLPIANTNLLSNILDLDSEEEEGQHDSYIELTP